MRKLKLKLAILNGHFVRIGDGRKRCRGYQKVPTVKIKY
jgi:hypothetical protein